MNETTEGAGQPEMERAEELVDAMGRTVSDLTSRLTREFFRGVALAREEAEDIWAEAQSMGREQRG